MATKKRNRRGTISLVAHTKGGAKKTTTVLNLAVSRARAGRKVVLVDCDVGRSLTAWNTDRTKRGQEPTFLCVQLFGNGVHREIEKLAEIYDDVIVDAGGEGESAPEIRLVLTVADMVITPCGTPETDWDRLKNMRAAITDARGLNESLDAVLFPIGASNHASAQDVLKFYKGVAHFPEYRVLKSVIRDRAAYKRWLEREYEFREGEIKEITKYSAGEGPGLAVMEQRRPDKAALAEMESLYAEVFND